MSSQSTKYSTLLFCLSYRCNLRCDVCSVGDRLESPDVIGLQEAIRIADECHDLGYTRRVGFTGGEPFLQYKNVLAITEHVYGRYGWESNATTNCTWATTDRVAQKRLAPLAARGLSWLLISIDDSHLRQTSESCVHNAIRAARQLGIRCQVQTVVTNGSRKADDFRRGLEEFASDDGIEWKDSRCVPMGFAADLPASAMPLTPGVLMGGCTLFKFIAVLPNGDVGLCCSYFPDELIVGNVRRETVAEILARAERNPVCNAVFTWGGPRLIADLLAEAGHPEYAAASYTNVCHSCHSILSDRRAVDAVRPLLSELGQELEDLKRKAESEWAYLSERQEKLHFWQRSA